MIAKICENCGNWRHRSSPSTEPTRGICLGGRMHLATDTCDEWRVRETCFSCIHFLVDGREVECEVDCDWHPDSDDYECPEWEFRPLSCEDCTGCIHLTPVSYGWECELCPRQDDDFPCLNYKEKEDEV